MINKDEKDKDKQVQLWERGLTDIKNLIGLAGEYGDLTKRDIKIKRSGARVALRLHTSISLRILVRWRSQSLRT